MAEVALREIGSPSLLLALDYLALLDYFDPPLPRPCERHLRLVDNEGAGRSELKIGDDG